MKYTIAVSALLYGSQALRLEDISLNQRKLYAQSLSQTGSNIHLFETEKSEEQNDREIQEMNMHLMQI